MERLKLVLLCALLVSLAGVAVQTILLLREATRAARALPVAVSVELRATRTALVGEIAATRLDLTAQVEAERQDILARADGQATVLQTSAMRQIGDIRDMVDRRLGDTLNRMDVALGTAEALRQDVAPAIAGAVSLESDARDSWDDVYWDVKASVESVTVAARGVAETSEAVSKAAPALAQSAERIGASADGIAADVRREADEMVKPKKWWQKALGPVYTVGRLVAAFL